jgi:hypothetical protein
MKLLKILLMFTVGVTIGFFGVFNSVFADGPTSERLIAITVILLIYGLCGAIFGYIGPKLNWKWGTILGFPGIIILIVYSVAEYNIIFLSSIYIILILLTTSLSTFFTSKIKNKSTNI